MAGAGALGLCAGRPWRPPRPSCRAMTPANFHPTPEAAIRRRGSPLAVAGASARRRRARASSVCALCAWTRSSRLAPRHRDPPIHFGSLPPALAFSCASMISARPRARRCRTSLLAAPQKLAERRLRRRMLLLGGDGEPVDGEPDILLDAVAVRDRGARADTARRHCRNSSRRGGTGWPRGPDPSARRLGQCRRHNIGRARRRPRRHISRPGSWADVGLLVGDLPK